ncbi:MAG: potassium channel family protein, partial [Chloroflexota bacterium]
PVRVALTFYDALICLVFLVDFVYNLGGSHPRRRYLVGQRGWLDLLGCVPAFGPAHWLVLVRLARLNRLAQIVRSYEGTHQKDLLRDVVRNRGQYALFFTLLVVMLVLTAASVLVLTFEAPDSQANIVTGGDALWWTFTTITTVGYGDLFPVTLGGRVVAVGVMFAGIGVIGALASILASILVPMPSPELESQLTGDALPETAPVAGVSSVAERALLEELGRLRQEVTLARAEVAEVRGMLAGPRQGPR